MEAAESAGPPAGFVHTVAAIAGREPSAEAVFLLRLATHLGAATAAGRGIAPEAPAHWRSLLAAALLAPDPASRWLQQMRHAFDLEELWPAPAARARALRLAGEGAAEPAGIGSEARWFSWSAEAQIRDAGLMAAPAVAAWAEAGPGPAPNAVLQPMHLIGAAILTPVQRHGDDPAIGRGNRARQAALRAHVAGWLADAAFALDRVWDDAIRSALSDADLAAPDLPPALAAALEAVEGDKFRSWLARIAYATSPERHPDLGTWRAAGPLGRLLLGRVARSDRAAQPEWEPWLDLLEEASGGVQAGELPAGGGLLAGQGHTLLARAMALAARVHRAGEPPLTLGLHHLVGAAFAPEEADLPPAVMPFPAFRRGLSQAGCQSIRRRFLGLVQQHHAGPGRPERRSAWTDLILGERLVTTRIATDLRPQEDLLGFRRYANAFASVIADDDVQPPLAIGLFGPWGSGKSAMIDMIDAALGEIDARAALDEEPRFCRGIIRVTFNAWHYAETNLWASLFVRILEEMSRHLRQEAPPDAQDARDRSLRALDAAREAQRQAEAAVAAAELDAARAREEEARAEAALSAARRAEAEAEAARTRAREEAQAAAASRIDALDLARDAGALLDAFGHPSLVRLAGAEGERLEALLREQEQELAGAVQALEGLAGPFGRLRAILGWNRPFLLALLLAGAAAALAAACLWLLDRYGVLQAAAGAILSILGGLAALAPLWRRSHALLARAPALMGRLAEAAEQVKSRAKARAEAETRARHAAETARAEREKAETAAALTQAEAGAARAAEAARNVAAARARAEAARQAVAAAEERMAALAPERLLSRFLADRAASEEYGRHLGLPTRIRRDLDDLRGYLADLARDGAATRRADRVVLFIDDLDRCPPGVVVKVLEAVHVLLASNLFVVVVGVDVRWLRKALETHHAGQFGAGGPLDPGEFLEKIFQVPFWVPAMSGAGRRAVLEAALPEMQRTGTGLSDGPGAAPSPGPGSAAAPPAGPAEPVAATAVAEAMAPLPTLDPVRLRPAEQAALLRWGALAGGTPRRLKRFARSYLILRASLPPAEREAFLDGAAYEDVARLLAFNCAGPELWPRLAAFVASAADGASWPGEWEELGPAWHAFFGRETDPPTPAACRPWLAEVQRFGFAAGQEAG